jgi:hypothetical protein
MPEVPLDLRIVDFDEFTAPFVPLLIGYGLALEGLQLLLGDA